MQGDQLNMTVLFWYLVKRDLSSVGFCTVAETISLIYEVPENGHVQPVTLYLEFPRVYCSGSPQLCWPAASQSPVPSSAADPDIFAEISDPDPAYLT